MKFTRAIAASALFIALLICTYAIHVTFFKVNVVFYAALTDVAIAATIAAALLYFTNFCNCLGDYEKLQLLMIWVITGYSIAISVPTVFDRSLSIYILEKLQQRGGGIRLDSFEKVFTEEYVHEHRLVDVRLTEQLESGTISIDAGCVRLTKKGEFIANFGRYFRSHWLPKQRLLMNQYSDDLTNPFRHSANRAEYECR